MHVSMPHNYLVFLCGKRHKLYLNEDSLEQYHLLSLFFFSELSPFSPQLDYWTRLAHMT